MKSKTWLSPKNGPYISQNKTRTFELYFHHFSSLSASKSSNFDRATEFFWKSKLRFPEFGGLMTQPCWKTVFIIQNSSNPKFEWILGTPPQAKNHERTIEESTILCFSDSITNAEKSAKDPEPPNVLQQRPAMPRPQKFGSSHFKSSKRHRFSLLI